MSPITGAIEIYGGIVLAEGGLLQTPWFPLMLIMIVGYFLLFSPERKKRAEMQQMLDGLKKNDRIITIGGIHGTVVDPAPSPNDVTIRVDDNTRIRILRSAINRVVVDEDPKDDAKAKS